MPLPRKRENEVIPQYSLTGDLISYLRCGLQYRYHSGSELPPSRPVQLWFGEFIHGVLEAAFRIWRAGGPPFPWPSNITPRHDASPAGRAAHDIGSIGEIVEGTLQAQGKLPRSDNARLSAYRRAETAVNEIGPHLFPLIASAEEKVIGTRDVPPPPPGAHGVIRANRYELHGIIDVLTHVQLTGAPGANVIRQAIQLACPGLAGEFEVIVDYKGSRRRPTNHAYWEQGNWQVQTYAWLRTRQPHSMPVAAGVLLYINELSPGADDLVDLRRDIQLGQTDVIPANGSHDAYLMNTWRPGDAIPNFSLEFRLARTIRVIPIDPVSQAHAVTQFDNVVQAIEQCVANEATAQSILGHWHPCGDDKTCAACDFRHFCPDPAPRNGPHIVEAPGAP